MINLFARLIQAKASTKLVGSSIPAIARQAAEQCVDDVCERVRGHMEGMTLAEARGYVRARAGRIVRSHLESLAAAELANDDAHFTAAARLTVERLIPQVLKKTRVGVPRTAPLRMAA